MDARPLRAILPDRAASHAPHEKGRAVDASQGGEAWPPLKKRSGSVVVPAPLLAGTHATLSPGL